MRARSNDEPWHGGKDEIGASTAPRRRPPARPAWSTAAAGVLILAVTVPFLDRAMTDAALLRHGLLPASFERDTAVLGVPPEAYDTAAAFTTLVLLAACAWTLMLGIGLLTRRLWARELALLTFVGFTLLLPLSIVGVLASPPAPNAWYGVMVGVVDGVIVALLSMRVTADDVEDAHAARKERRHGPRLVR